MRKKDAAAVPAPDSEKKLRLDYPQTFKVGCAFAIIMVFWTAYDFVVPLLLENAFGLSNMMRGLIMGLDNLLALFLLPLFGKLSDRSKSKLTNKMGRRTPFILFGTIASVILMIFVPVSAQQQLNASAEVRASLTAQLNDDDFMSERLSSFYDNPKYVDTTQKLFLKDNGITLEKFTAIRFDSNLETSSGFMGIGGTSYKYNGVDVQPGDTVSTQRGDMLVSDIAKGNKDYEQYAKSAMDIYISEQVEEKVLNSDLGIKSLVIYMVILLLVLIAMAVFRSPAVALMPDVTPKPLRSQANAVINLMGGIGGAVAFLIYTVVLFQSSLYNYTIIFGSVAAAMLMLLGLFLIFVKERKLVDKCRKTCEEYGITDEENERAELEKLSEEAVNNPFTSEAMTIGELEHEKAKRNKVHDFNAKIEAKFNAKYAHLTQDERKVKLEKAKKISFLLILASIFMWFMGYNSVSSNLSIYCVKALNLSPGVASIISGVSMGVSAIAFIPVGILAVKIGRRKSIMIGFGLAVLSFVLIYTPLISMAKIDIARAAVFALFYLIAGFGLIIANVNTFPMVTELSTEATVGQYTGYYYAATMSAQAITPFIAGALMDKWGSSTLFIYAAVCIVIAIALMLFVRYGDSAQIPKGKKLSKDERKQVMLDAMDSAD